MVSKNNLKLRDQWATKQVPHYGLRKLGIGVASVLLSTSIYGVLTAQADANNELTATGTSTQSVDINQYHFDNNLYQNDNSSVNPNLSHDPKVVSPSETQPASQPKSAESSPTRAPEMNNEAMTSPATSENVQPSTQSNFSARVIHAPAIKLAQVNQPAAQPAQTTDQPGDEDTNHPDQPPVDQPDTPDTPTDQSDHNQPGQGNDDHSQTDQGKDDHSQGHNQTDQGNDSHSQTDHNNTDDSHANNSGDSMGDQTNPSTDDQSGEPNEQPTSATQTLLIQYRDEANQVIQTLSLQGTIGQAVSLPQTFPAGWQLAPTATLPATVTLQANQTPLVVPIVHRHQVVDKDHLPLGVTLADLQKAVTRTIKYQTPLGAQQTIQRATLTRTGDLDLVTMHITFGPWSTGNWPAFSLPAIPGYTVTDAGYPATPVTGATQNTTLTLPADVYQANPQSAVVKFVDAGNPAKVIASQVLHGVTGQTIPLTYQIPTGWELVPGQDLPQTLTFAAQDNPAITVLIQASTSEPTPSRPVNDSTDEPTKHDDARVPNSDASTSTAGTTSDPSAFASSRGDDVNPLPSALLLIVVASI